MNYFKKYLKYKNKYIKLRKQQGGTFEIGGLLANELDYIEKNKLFFIFSRINNFDDIEEIKKSMNDFKYNMNSELLKFTNGDISKINNIYYKENITKEDLKGIGLNEDDVFNLWTENIQPLLKYKYNILDTLDQMIKDYILTNNISFTVFQLDLIKNLKILTLDIRIINKILTYKMDLPSELYDKFRLLLQINKDLLEGEKFDNLVINIFNNYEFGIACMEDGSLQGITVNCLYKDIHVFIKDNPMSQMNILKICNYDISNNEQQDYLDEMLYYIIPENTKCYHATSLVDKVLINFGEYDHMINPVYLKTNNQSIFFWTQELIGQKEYGGGWFTFNQKDSGPSASAKFGLVLEYNVREEFPILFIPPIYNNLTNDKLFNTINEYEKNNLKDYTTLHKWSGSHVFQGVYNWKEKRYSIIKHPLLSTYADNFAKKIVNLGFKTGYISCDECEIFLPHEIQATKLDRIPTNVFIDENWWNGKIFANVYFKVSNGTRKYTKEQILDRIKIAIEGISYNNKISSLENRDVKYKYIQDLKLLLDRKFDEYGDIFALVKEDTDYKLYFDDYYKRI
uniref:Uncharacterized protein n=1 Tax=viral metagenome TaxID=1070528 RepID=A0A6C0DB22_9ZZZZ